MKDNKIIDSYNKGIKYKFLKNSGVALIAIIVTVINHDRELLSLFGVITIATIIGLLFVLITTPLEWKITKRKYEKIIKNQN